MEEIKNSKKSILILLASSFVGALVLMKFFGSWYLNAYKPVSLGFWGPEHPEYLEGFLFGYYLIFSLLCPISLKKPWQIFGWGIAIPLVVFGLLVSAWLQIKLDLIIIIIGSVLGWLARLTIQKFNITF